MFDPDALSSLEMLEARAKALAVSGPAEEAEKVNVRIIALSPDNLSGYRRLGKIYKDRGDVPQATEAYERVLELAPGDTIARNQLERLRGGPSASGSMMPSRMASGSGNDTTWSHDDIFPLIAQIIDRMYKVRVDWIGRDDIRDALLLDQGAVLHIEAAAGRLRRTQVHVAGNMVDWWSATYTSGTNAYAYAYERGSSSRKAAYRPKR